MRVMVFVKATEESEKGFDFSTPENRRLMEEMGKFNDELAKAGIFVAAEGFRPSSYGKRISFDGVSRTVSDGPFPHPREQVTGMWIWDVKDMDGAVEWVKKCPNPMPGPSDIEIRPCFEPSDFA